jgi:hypothetical protein
MAGAATIGKAQAKAIAEGFLDSVGSNRQFSDFEPDESLATLIELAAMIIVNAQKNLNEGGHIGSGQLSDSLKVNDPAFVSGRIRLDIQALYYYQFINKGVKGTSSGSSIGGYAFKYATPSKKMVLAIAEWIKRAHKVTTHLLKKHAISKTEHKNATLSDMDNAYMVARSIVQHGIKRSSFFDKAITIAQQFSREQLGHALAVDIINTIPKTIGDGNSNQK